MIKTRLIGLIGFLAISGCAAQRSVVDEVELTICLDPRPQVCTMDYNPVCARLEDASTATYANGCGACSDPRVEAHAMGSCEP